MPSAVAFNDGERREVARRLEEYASGLPSTCTYLVHDWISVLEYCGVHLDSATRREQVERIADLIEPEPERTCQIVSAFDTDELEDVQDLIASSPEDTLAYMCKSCGFDFRYERGLYPNYCPNCGARMLNDA